MRLATLEDVIHIYNTMWDRGREELKHLGISPNLWFAGWIARLERSDAVAFGNHAILGCDHEMPGVVCTAFQASRSFESAGKQVTKEMRKAIPKLMNGRGIYRIHTYSLCVDPGSEKWFRLLGLEEDLTYQGIKRGPYRMRRFVRSC